MDKYGVSLDEIANYASDDDILLEEVYLSNERKNEEYSSDLDVGDENDYNEDTSCRDLVLQNPLKNPYEHDTINLPIKLAEKFESDRRVDRIIPDNINKKNDNNDNDDDDNKLFEGINFKIKKTFKTSKKNNKYNNNNTSSFNKSQGIKTNAPLHHHHHHHHHKKYERCFGNDRNEKKNTLKYNTRDGEINNNNNNSQRQYGGNRNNGLSKPYHHNNGNYRRPFASSLMKNQNKRFKFKPTSNNCDGIWIKIGNLDTTYSVDNRRFVYWAFKKIFYMTRILFIRGGKYGLLSVSPGEANKAFKMNGKEITAGHPINIEIIGKLNAEQVQYIMDGSIQPAGITSRKFICGRNGVHKRKINLNNRQQQRWSPHSSAENIIQTSPRSDRGVNKYEVHISSYNKKRQYDDIGEEKRDISSSSDAICEPQQKHRHRLPKRRKIKHVDNTQIHSYSSKKSKKNTVEKTSKRNHANNNRNKRMSCSVEREEKKISQIKFPTLHLHPPKEKQEFVIEERIAECETLSSPPPPLPLIAGPATAKITTNAIITINNDDNNEMMRKVKTLSAYWDKINPQGDIVNDEQFLGIKISCVY